MKKGLLALLLMTLSFWVLAAPEVMTFQSEAQEQQYRKLTAELRCPKCQNNSIADSGSLIAEDLRLKVYQLTLQGKTRDQIVDFMVARYGAFIRYDPPLTPVTLLLWLLPLLSVLAGGYAIYARSRTRIAVAPIPCPADTLSARGSPWGLVAGIIMALAVSGAAFYSTNGYRQVRDWQQATRQLPELMNRTIDSRAAPLEKQALQTLALGLRTHLADDGDNPEGWMLLGRVGMMLNNATLATQAYGRAHAVAPDDLPAASGYADVLTRTGELESLQQAEALLAGLLNVHPDNLRLLQLAAVNAYQQGQYDLAIARWQRMLLLNNGNPEQRAEIEQKIALARQHLSVKPG
ncbi:cytochrome c biogenesis protein CcmH [Enterobacteriaceae bacterium RIT714]|nr:cytochrome c biogenesis protein CcmH [Enterobacteriaceae bacterium RIT714]